MERFEVRAEQEDLWSISKQGQRLYSYASEDEARRAALMLASDLSRDGTQAKVVIMPATSPVGGFPARERFTGM